jgi:hypothetical protein
MKGVIRPDHIPVNKYQLLIIGLPPLTFTEVSGIEDELETADMPDRTVASGGNRKASEFTAMLPMHHSTEQAAMESWFRESQDPVSPSYKKAGTLVHSSISGITVKTFQLVGVFPFKRKLPDLEMVNEGEMAAVEWSFKVDDTLPL